MEKIVVEGLYKVFGPHPEKALRMLEAGQSKDEIMEKTRHGVGVANASFVVNAGEILVGNGTFRQRQVDTRALYQPPDRTYGRPCYR